MTAGPASRSRAGALALLAAASVALAACGSGGDVSDAAEETTTTSAPAEPTSTTSTTSTPTSVVPVAPLTGEPLADQARRERPALVVKVDATARAIGRQEGIDVADVVFVEKVEGGTLRLAAVFHSEDATVGPIRSARTSDLEIAGNLGRPLFAFSGANVGVLRQVREADLVDVGYDAVPRSYGERGTGVLRFFVDTAVLRGFAPEAAAPPRQQLRYRAPGEPVVNAGVEPASTVTVRYPGSPGTLVTYADDGGRWARSQGGVAHTAADGTRIAPENVIVQFIDYRDSGYRDVTGAVSPEAVLSGEGDAWVFTGGSLIRARWSRADPGALTEYTDAEGQPVRFAPGRTWIELAHEGSASVG